MTEPPEAQGQWRLVWEGTWHNSGDVISGLPTGNYPVTFSPVAGFTEPGTVVNPVTSGTLTAGDKPIRGDGDGDLWVADGDALSGGRGDIGRCWGRALWHASGFAATNLVSGNHIVVFQGAAGYVTPAPLAAYVGGNAGNEVAATYLVEEQIGATPPSVLQFSDATTPEFGLPYVYNGQLLTDVGYGSGCVVQPRVVLTAGHLVFNDTTLSYVNSIYWFFQEQAGVYNPAAQTPAGLYALGGYAAARTNDLTHGGSPGVESPAAQNLDVAALYFLADAGRRREQRLSRVLRRRDAMAAGGGAEDAGGVPGGQCQPDQCRADARDLAGKCRVRAGLGEMFSRRRTSSATAATAAGHCAWSSRTIFFIRRECIWAGRRTRWRGRLTGTWRR